MAIEKILSNVVVDGTISKVGGTSSQFLKADGSVDSTTYTTNTGTVTSVTAGNGMTQSGTSTINPTLNIVSHAGSAGTIGTINIGADAIGVNLGTTSTTAAAGNDARLSDARTPLAHNQAWSTITSTPTTLSGYGITDAAPISGSANYIQNQNASVQSANMWISGSGLFGSGDNSVLTIDGYSRRIGFTKKSGFGPYLTYGNTESLVIAESSASNIDATNTFTPRVTIANGGAATFASTVTASNGTLIGGTLTSGYIPKATGVNSIGNSLIYDNGTNVGIGTTSPSAKLNVLGNIHLGSYSDTSINTYEIRTNKALFSIASDGVTNGNGTLITYSWANGGQGPLRFNNASGEVMRLSSGGNVGIGTTSPVSKLTINGTANTNANVITIFNNNTIADSYSAIGSYYADGNLNVNAQIRFGNEFTAGGSSFLAFATSFGTTPSEKMRIASNGNVLIGTTTDNGNKLRVEGDTYISGKVSLGQSTYHKPATTQCAGEIVYYGTGTTVAGKLYYLSTGLVWTLADSDAVASSSGMLGIAIGTDPATNGMLVRGSARFDALTPYTAMTAGQILYVSTTAGDFTATAPTGTGKVVRVIGYCVDDTNNTLYFCPDNTWIELT